MTKNEKRVQKTIQWDSDVLDALEKHNKQQRLNNLSAAANDAVRYALFPEYRSDREKDMVKLMQDLRASLYEHRKTTARDLMILQEGLFQFIDVFFMHTHSIPKSELAAAKAQAKARLDEFMEQLVRKVQDPKRKAQEKE
jgi:hypothetical protein